MTWLEPVPDCRPRVRSLEGFVGQRLIFRLVDGWTYYPAYTPTEYLDALDLLVRGASLALGDGPDPSRLTVTMDPFGARWIEWVLPMEGWCPHEAVVPEWDAQILRYAELFENGTLAETYAGACVTHKPDATLRFCADLVIRNLAPASWLFAAHPDGVVAYFHNTSSFGICLPEALGGERDLIAARVEELGLECLR